jgi:hypothetical protein
MDLVVAGTFGSLPEASIAFSSLSSAGFNPVAGYNMNTPGIAGGMAPSAYRVLVPADEGQAARQFLSELLHAFAGAAAEDQDDAEPAARDLDTPGRTTLGRVRLVVRFLAAVAVAACAALLAFEIFWR